MLCLKYILIKTLEKVFCFLTKQEWNIFEVQPWYIWL